MINDKNPSEKNLWPATLYVEGQDQFRGWFNSSLITSVVLAGQAPYKQVLTHGFVVDEKGCKMSKSLGNVIDPKEIMEKFGVDILRLWVASSDFTKEIKVSIPILQNLQENYQKIRNTLRFLLGNLAHLPSEWKSESDLAKELTLIDYYILSQLKNLIQESQKKYAEYNFNSVYINLLKFCVNDLSSFYFEVSKDSLYCDTLTSLRRKQIITTLYYLLWGLLKITAPILPFLVEEVYQNIPFKFGFANRGSIQLVIYPPNLISNSNIKKKLPLITDFFFPLRQELYQILEKARQEKIIDLNSQACLTIYLKKAKKLFDYSELSFAELLLVAEVKFVTELENNMWESKLCFVKVEKTFHARCVRCWNYRVWKSDLCSRCKKIILVLLPL